MSIIRFNTNACIHLPLRREAGDLSRLDGEGAGRRRLRGTRRAERANRWAGVSGASGFRGRSFVRIFSYFNHSDISFDFDTVSTLMALCASAQDTWRALILKQPIKMEVLKPQGSNSANPLPAILYLENLATPRVGTDSDDAIVHDFLSEGYLVVKLRPQTRPPPLHQPGFFGTPRPGAPQKVSARN